MREDLAERVAALLQPVPGPHPGGRDLRYEGDYDRIAEARREEDARQSRGVWLREVKQADWGLVERLCVEALTAKTKDLRIAAWLAEAWVRQHGFAGLAPGLTLIEGLCRLYWEQLQPGIDQDGGVHIAAIDWLNQHLPIALRQVPVVANRLMPDDSYHWSDYRNAEHLETVRLQDRAAAQKSEAAGAVVLAQFEACRDRTSSEMLAAIAADLCEGLEALAALDATLDMRCGKDAPGLSRIRNVATEIADYARDAVSNRVAVPAVVDAPGPDPAPIAPAPVARGAAYRQLAAIADLLRASEPHSPVPYVLDHLVAWGAMSLPELQAQLADADSDISILLAAMGLGAVERQ